MTEHAASRDDLENQAVVHAIIFTAIPLIIYIIEGFEEGVLAGFAVLIVLQVIDTLVG